MKYLPKKTLCQLKLIQNEKKELTKHLLFRKLKSVNNPNSIHGIYPYRGKISAIDAKQIISQLSNQGTLLDPFCGSGTIVYEAQQWELNAIGFDNNPLAVNLSLAKTQPLNIKDTISHSRAIVQKAESLGENIEMPISIEKYFHKQTSYEIMRMFTFKDEMSRYEIATLYGAVCLTARACNNYKWSSNSVGKIITPHRYVNFYQMYLKKLQKHIPYVNGGTPATILKGDSRELSKFIPENSVDYVFTSPPYFDALDYTSYYAKIIFEIENSDRKAIRKGLIQNVSTYKDDMKVVLKEIEKVSKKGAMIIFVVGDKKMKDGIVINGGEFFSNISDWKPTYILEREYSGTTSQIWDKINKTQRKEQIVVWIKD